MSPFKKCIFNVVGRFPTFRGQHLKRKSKAYFSIDKIIYYGISIDKIVKVVDIWLVHLWARSYGLNYEKAFCVISA